MSLAAMLACLRGVRFAIPTLLPADENVLLAYLNVGFNPISDVVEGDESAWVEVRLDAPAAVAPAVTTATAIPTAPAVAAATAVPTAPAAVTASP